MKKKIGIFGGLSVIAFFVLAFYFTNGIFVGAPKLNISHTISFQQMTQNMYGLSEKEEYWVVDEKNAWIGIPIDTNYAIKSITIDNNSSNKLPIQVSSCLNNSYENLEISYVDLQTGKNVIPINRSNIGYLQLNIVDQENSEIHIDKIQLNYFPDNQVFFWRWFILIEISLGILLLVIHFFCGYMEKKEKMLFISKLLFAQMAIYCFLSLMLYGSIRIPESCNTIIGISNEALQRNVAGYSVNNGKYLTKTNYPWITLELNDYIDDMYLNFEIKQLQQEEIPIGSVASQIYYANETKFVEMMSNKIDIHNGTNIYRIGKGNINSLRLDFARKSNVSFVVESAYLTDGFIGGTKLYIISFVVMLILGVFVCKNRKDENLKEDNFIEGVSQSLKKFCVEIQDFMQKHYKICFAIGVILIAAYSVLCNYYTIYVDEERAYIDKSPAVAWLNQGRFGSFLIEKLFFVNGVYTPFFGDFVAILFLGISAILACLLFRKAKSDLSTISMILFSAIYCTVPYVCGAYMIVGIFNVQIGIGLCLTMLAIDMTIDRGKERLAFYFVPCILFAYAISIYQAFISYYITMVILYYVIVCIFSSVDMKRIILGLVRMATLCVSSTATYWGINKLVTNMVGGTSYYEDNFIGWNGEKGIWQVIQNVFSKIISIYRGSADSVYGGITIRVTVILYFLIIIYVVINNKKKKMVAFLGICSLLAPFALSILLGGGIFAGRTTLGFLGLFGAIWLLLLEIVKNRKAVKNICIFLAIICTAYQLQYLNNFFISDFKRYEIDKTIASQVVNEIRNVNNGSEDIPVVFVGAYYNQSDLVLTYENAGSYFCVDGGSIKRIVNFMKSEGYLIDMPSQEQIIDSRNFYDEMECWPASDSVINTNRGYVIVKLGNPTEKWEYEYIDYYLSSTEE